MSKRSVAQLERQQTRQGAIKKYCQQTEKIGYYRWATEGDERVRDSHAANDGEIFAWNNPPATGHPGEAPGCRCTAIPITVTCTENRS